MSKQPGHLLINEVDYDQLGADTAEFIESSALVLDKRWSNWQRDVSTMRITRIATNVVRIKPGL